MKLLNMKGFCLLLVMSALPISGCYFFTVPVYKMMAPNADYQVKKLEKRQAYLEKRYEKKTETIKKSVSKQKNEIKAALKKKDVAKALAKIDALYKYTFPCGKDECDVKRGKYIYGRDYIFREEDIDREEDFIEDSLDDTYKISQNLAKRGQFGRLEVGLAKLDKQIKFDSGRRKKFVSFKKNLKSIWLKSLLTRAKKQEKAYPGLALLNYYKAMSLAVELRDNKRAQQIKNTASTFRRTVYNQASYSVFARGKGPLTGGMLTRLRKSKPSGVQYVRQPNKWLKSTLTVVTERPSFSISNKTARSSFQYTSGTKTVPNPKYADAKRKMKLAANNYSRCNGACGVSSKFCRVTLYNGSTRDFGVGNNNRDCDAARSWKAEMENQRAIMQAEGSTKVVSKKANYGYNYTLHTHAGQAQVSYRFAPKSGRSVSEQYVEKTALTDKEHPAFRHGDGSVGADPKSIPSQRSVWDKLVGEAAAQVNTALGKLSGQYFESMKVRGGLEDGKAKAVRASSLVMYMVATGKTLKNKESQVLDSTSGVPNAATLINPNAKKTSKTRRRRYRRRRN